MPPYDVMEMLGIAQRIEAEERIKRIADAQIASGWAKKSAPERHIRRLQAEARRGTPGQEVKRTNLFDSLVGLGVPVREVSKSA